MVRVKPLLAALGLVAVGVAAGVLLLASPGPIAQSGSAAETGPTHAVAGDAAAELQNAQERAPYQIRQPSWLPTGYELHRVSFDSDPGAAGGHAFSVDLKYVSSQDQVIHLWQTNLTPQQMGPTNPLALAGSTPLSVGATTWVAAQLPVLDGIGRTQLAYRDRDGITITVDGPELTDLVGVAESLAATR